MKILITNIDYKKTHLLSGQTVSYEGEFQSDLCLGKVFFVPNGKDLQILKIGKIISVGTDIKEVKSIELIENASEPKLTPLKDPFCYEIVGGCVNNTDDSVFDMM